ncbi:hypothetical protein OSL24_23590, partial [Escherichia coli]|nr:hypothetical protein [Escherichia coli]MDA6259585.1 hypothetical protein [Escherichia coli]MDA6397540.1 hypothetical protein [Escherichia coli]MDA6421687.1 hypothetical protein [Escherichia coli]MDA6446331.1 hypothetical protein [Escherichia coli]
KRVFLVILFTSFSGSLVSRIPGAVHPVCFTYPRYCLTCGAVHSHHLHRSVPYTVARQKKGFGSLPLVLNV